MEFISSLFSDDVLVNFHNGIHSTSVVWCLGNGGWIHWIGRF